MKKLAGIILSIFLFSASASAQNISFEIQTGFKSNVRRIIQAGSPNVFAIISPDGNLALWDAGQNKITAREQVGNELYDLVYIPANRQLALCTPGEVLLYSIREGRLEQEGLARYNNPTALYTKDQKLWAACSDRVVEFDLRRSRLDEVVEYATESHTAYALKVYNDQFFLADNGGFYMYEKSPAWSVTTEAVDTSSVDEAQAGSGSGSLRASLEYFNTGWYAHAWDSARNRLIVPREEKILYVSIHDSIHVTTVDLAQEEDKYFTGLAVNGDALYAANRNGVLFFIDMHSSQVRDSVELGTGSVTSLGVSGSLLAIGDYYGNCYLYAPGLKKEIISLQEDYSPEITGVYFRDDSLMVTTHKGTRGASLKLWDMTRASLVYSVILPAQQSTGVFFTKDSIYSFHVDDAIYAIVKKTAVYDTVQMHPPSIPFFPGFGMTVAEQEPMWVTSEMRNKIRTASSQGGVHRWQEPGGQYAFVLDAAPPAVSCEVIPPYAVVQRYLHASGILPYLSGMDVLDQDLFFMKACRSGEKEFLAYAKEKGLPNEPALRLSRMLRSKSGSRFSFVDIATKDTLFTTALGVLELIVFNPLQKKAMILFDSSAIVYDLSTRKTTHYQVQIPKEMFVTAMADQAVAIATPARVTVYKPSAASPVNWLIFGKDNYLLHDEAGYYKTRGRTNRLIAYRDGYELPFTFFDAQFNRPDTIVGHLAGRKSPIAQLYRSAVLKRISRMPGTLRYPAKNSSVSRYGDLHLPLPLVQQDILQIPVIPAGAKLRQQSWVNGVLHRENNRQWKLSAGQNKIDIQWLNTRGDTIYHQQTHYVYNPGKPATHWYYFGAANDRYYDSSLNLRYAVQDVKDIAAGIKSLHQEATLSLLTNSIQEENPFAAWRESLSRTTVHDVVIMSFSGHGFLDSLQQFCFASPGSTSGRMIPMITYDSILALMEAAPARRKILLIDACHSGELDEETAEYPAQPGVTLRAFGVKNAKATSSTQAFRIMQEEFFDLGRHSGTMVIAASAGNEYAMESSRQKNGLFTYALIEGWFEKKADADQDEKVSIDELQDYLNREVLRLSGGGQKPSTRQSNQGPEWIISN
jgi:hypothetical protein